MSNLIATFFLLTWIVTMTAGQMCITRYLDGEWRLDGDCQSEVSMQDVMASIDRMAREETANDVQTTAAVEGSAESFQPQHETTEYTHTTTKGSTQHSPPTTGDSARDSMFRRQTKPSPTVVPTNVEIPRNDWRTSGNRSYICIRNETRTYTGARAACRSYGGRLAAEVLRHLNAARYIAGNCRKSWIGFDDMRKEGTWVWSDGGAMNTSTIGWKRGQPDNERGKEDCAQIWMVSNQKLPELNDRNCGAKLYYICEV